jgi:bifunctional DNA-binding transcriptional regulator/antitoxin component of YhaV-PrlF toxin-antitoxin module
MISPPLVTPQRFTATLEASDRGGGRWLVVPFDAREVFGQARPPVRGTVNGTPVRGRLAVYGGTTYLGLRREIREAAGIDVGDDVEVVLELDDAPREVEVPAELEAALDADAQLRAAFDALAFTHRREYAEWVGEAKRQPTRDARAAKAAQMLRDGVEHP